MSDPPVVVLEQEDTFFNIGRGRLKLRESSAGHVELIYYERQDTPGPRRSNFLISPTTEPESLKEVLTAAFGIAGVVRKRRWLYHAGQTRIQLDEVEGL